MSEDAPSLPRPSFKVPAPGAYRTTVARAMLLGRHNYEAFVRVWPNASMADAAVAAMNRMPKYVASRTYHRGPK